MPLQTKKRIMLILKQHIQILLPCLATALIVRSYYLVRECETRKVEEVIRSGIVALSQKDKHAFFQLLSNETSRSFDFAWVDQYFDFRTWLNLDTRMYDQLQVGHVDMNFRLSSADAYLYMGNVPDFPLLPFSVNGVTDFLFDEGARFETLDEWMDGRMTLKFTARKENGVWKLNSLPELICR